MKRFHHRLKENLPISLIAALVANGIVSTVTKIGVPYLSLASRVPPSVDAVSVEFSIGLLAILFVIFLVAITVGEDLTE